MKHISEMENLQGATSLKQTTEQPQNGSNWTKEHKLRMVELWKELSILYDSQASRRFGQVGDRVFIEWGQRLSSFSDDELKTGLNGCLESESNYAPSLKEFIGFCRKGNAGLTHNTAAYREYRKDRLLTQIPDREKAKAALDDIYEMIGSKPKSTKN